MLPEPISIVFEESGAVIMAPGRSMRSMIWERRGWVRMGLVVQWRADDGLVFLNAAI